MAELLPDPAQEKGILYSVIDNLHRYWGTRHMAKFYSDLVHAVARAEQALSHLHPLDNIGDTAFRVHVLGLGCLTQVARDERARVERFVLTLVEKEAATQPLPHSATRVPGTINPLSPSSHSAPAIAFRSLLASRGRPALSRDRGAFPAPLRKKGCATPGTHPEPPE